ncbi:MAG: exodeoxyribonuclease VII large subunit [Candidatus Hydrogenedentes bacterium]|nr:exodeoxyribonuclease VII large subunit [Candidatus Hydrogenedentota bacterium]
MAVDLGKVGGRIWKVSELNEAVKNLLEGSLGYIWVSGEVSNWKINTSGHAYFTLKDEGSEISAVMFSSRIALLKFRPENGMEVIAYGLVTLYSKRGTYQIVVEDIEPKGMGALQIAFEQLKKKLAEEGLFDEAHKKPLPFLPRKIGIVTSPTGAAIRDILKVLSRRFANLHIVLYPAKVQGEGSANEIVSGIKFLDNYGVDVIIVGRGGGSLEDLWTFNEEIVVRAVYEAKTPIISAVGHEIDYTLTDFAADVRAPTPSAAAEMVVREQRELLENIKDFEKRLLRNISMILNQYVHKLEVLLKHRGFDKISHIINEDKQYLADLFESLQRWWEKQRNAYSQRIVNAEYRLQLVAPLNRVRLLRERLISSEKHLKQGIKSLLNQKRITLYPMLNKLDVLSPLRVLSRGYSLVWLEPKHVLVKETNQIKRGDLLNIRFFKGEASVTVEEILPFKGNDNVGG